MKGNILIIDDNKSVLTALELLLETAFNQVYTLSSTNSILTTIQNKQVDVILLDMNFRSAINTGNEGIFWLNEIQKSFPRISIIMITAYGDIELAVKAVKMGAYDFILKPWDNDKLVNTITKALKLKNKQKENIATATSKIEMQDKSNWSFKSFIGKSPAINDVLEMIKKVANTDANIFITGENGTGKELIAREIHNLSKRNKEALVTVDMGAVSKTLFESELFGHKKGAFTDAKEDRIGKFEMAHKGSLFLDEIGNLPMDLQAKILVALQNRRITAIGSNKEKPVDIRLISATNNNIEEMVANGAFRQDLLFRINTITIELPPLRERGNDIILLAEFFIHKYTGKYNKSTLILSERAKTKLLNYKWPGNVRELEHCIEKAVILAEEDTLNENDFNLVNTIAHNKDISFDTIEEMEKQMILKAIDKECGNMSTVAKKLGITRQTLYNKLKKYEI
jgi:DNA-binding NtrC family response regulator